MDSPRPGRGGTCRRGGNRHGLDAGFLTRVSTASTAALEQGLLDRFKPESPANSQPAPSVVDGGPGMMMGGPAMTGGPAMAGGPAMMMKAKPVEQSSDLPIEGALPRWPA